MTRLGPSKSALILFALGLGLVSACPDDPVAGISVVDASQTPSVGQACAMEESPTASPAQTLVNANAASCPARICLRPAAPTNTPPPDTGPFCTAECQTDDDCVGATRNPSDPADRRCRTGFVCAIPTVTGPLCCRKLCVCRDFLGPTGPEVPPECTVGGACPNGG